MATAIRVDDDLSEYNRDFRVAFDSCGMQGYEIDGNIVGSENRAAKQVRMLESKRLTWLKPDGESVRFSGLSAVQRNSDGTDTQCGWQMINTNIVARPNDIDTIINANNMLVELDRKASVGTAVGLNAEIILTSEATGRHVLVVSARNLKTPHGTEQAPDGWYFTEGSLSIVSVDGSRLELGEAVQSMSSEVTNGAVTPAIAIRVINSDGVFEFSAPWVTWQTRLADATARLCGS